MAGLDAWLVGYYSGHQHGMLLHAGEDEYKRLFGGAPDLRWSDSVNRFEALGLLRDLTAGFENGIAFALWDCGQLIDEPSYTCHEDGCRDSCKAGHGHGGR